MKAFVWYVAAISLVVAYVHTFTLWRLLRLQFGDGAALVPWLLAAVLAIVIAAFWHRRSTSARGAGGLLAAALGVAIVGMLLADTAFPAKRVHVPEYAILAAVVWAALRQHVASDRIVLATVLIVGLFGVHDEFLQALHPDRSFGARDMLVNLAGGIAGSLALAGLTGRRLFAASLPALPAPVFAGGAMALVGLLLYVGALMVFRGQPVPYWTGLPVLAGTLALALAITRDEVSAETRHVGTVVVVQLIVLIFYPVIANETPLVFA